MFSITNEKVAGFLPRWAGFRGFSILFDNPGKCLMPSGGHLNLACDVDGDLALTFYQALRNALNCLNPDLLTTAYLFCPLPPASYHVTVWDGGNDGNAAQVVGTERQTMERFLVGLPDTLTPAQEVTALARISPLVTRQDWNIPFEFDRLALWGNVVVVARLSPTEASQDAFQAFVEERRQLSAAFRQVYGIGPSENYVPHVSLGYFANREGAQMASPCLDNWNRVFAERMQGLTLTFQSAAVYGFTDMATFFKTAE